MENNDDIKNSNNQKKSKSKKEKLLSKIINTTSEYRPSLNSQSWKGLNNKNYRVTKRVLKYNITQDLIDTMDKYREIYESLNSNNNNNKELKIVDEYDDNIALIYIIDNKRTGEAYIDYTTSPLFTLIKESIHKKNIGENNVLDYFKYRKLTEFSFELLEYINYVDKKDITDRIRFWQGKLLVDYEKVRGGIYPYSDEKEFLSNSEIDNDKLYNKRMSVFFDVLAPFIPKFKSTKGYIYKVMNKKNKLIFIGGDSEKLSKEEILKILKKMDNFRLEEDFEKYDDDTFKVILLETYIAKSQFDLMLRIDYHKILNKSIEYGYNMGYCLEESEKLFGKTFGTRVRERIERSFFLRINKYLFNEFVKDDTDYTKIYGFVYQIQHKRSKKRFISHVHMSTLKQVVSKLYDSAISGNVKHSKILKVMAEEPYSQFNYSILVVKKMNDTTTDIKSAAMRCISMYNTIKNGYNIDNDKLRKDISMGKNKVKKKANK